MSIRSFFFAEPKCRCVRQDGYLELCEECRLKAVSNLKAMRGMAKKWINERKVERVTDLDTLRAENEVLKARAEAAEARVKGLERFAKAAKHPGTSCEVIASMLVRAEARVKELETVNLSIHKQWHEEVDTFRDLARELAEALDAEVQSPVRNPDHCSDCRRITKAHAALQRAREAGVL